MKAKHMKKEFEKRSKKIEKKLQKLKLEDGINSMIKFYQEERIENCRFENDADMLLFECGNFNFRGKPEFSITITRQIVDPKEDEPFQLQLTFYYDDKKDEFKSGNFWCSNLTETDEFRDKILLSTAYLYFTKMVPNDVVLNYEQC